MLQKIKNMPAWVSVLTAVLTATGMPLEMFTSWQIVWDSIVTLALNPMLLLTTGLTIYGVITNHEKKEKRHDTD